MLTPTGFTPVRDQSVSQAIDEIVSRAKTLYTLPVVAAEVLQLTSNPSVEPQAIKECILRDPALTAKILRVVNSSLFGLPGEVCDLNQAIALLGIKPLKILVLGFSLPDNLFAGVARDQLKWYWTTTLTRAVAAREISEQLFKRPGDEAFLAGLLQGLGVLVLAKQLGPAYAVLLRNARETGLELRQVEEEALGFDHLKLTSTLMKGWNMPRQLTEAIASQHDPMSLAREHRLNGTLERVLHLANLTENLVGQHRLSVLPDLLEAGDVYCDLNRSRLHDLIINLQPKVNHLADVLSLEVGQDTDYASILKAAHELMSELAESAFGPAQQSSISATPASVLQMTSELRNAMNNFLRDSAGTKETQSSAAKHFERFDLKSKGQADDADGQVGKPNEQFLEWLTVIAANCRSRRQPLSVLMLEISAELPHLEAYDKKLTVILGSERSELLPPNSVVDDNGAGRRTLILPAMDRHDSVSLAHEIIRTVEHSCQNPSEEGKKRTVVRVGIGSVTLPSRSFRPADILDTAERCLAAARSRESSVVKSLEVY